ncbi:Plug domain-containing protein [Xylophilus sp.]|uniref:Plug domain-containing protein n=1 Tax=Xylophilus sp. TaxID=2653893 RepID=UPI0013B5E4A3|nr:Plug domain-containing protein [Xylophilus sp.]KAF1044195.1 MAG: Colicin I receptor [Xylophilus sp.]
MKNRPHALRPVPSAVLLAVLMQGQHASAQQSDAAAADSLKLPDVVISSERRQSLQKDTPVSVAVTSSEELQKLGYASLQDLVGVAPGLTIPPGYRNQLGNIYIRGVIGAAYLDDTPVGSGMGATNFDLPDIERIELVRGPQGTLFGQNSTGGAIRVISRDPDGSLILPPFHGHPYKRLTIAIGGGR